MCWGSDGAYTSLPTAMIDHEGANFFAPTTPWATMGSSGPSASVSYEGVQLSGVVGDTSGGPKIQVGSPFAGQSAVTIGPTFPPFAPNPGWAPGMILITSGNVCGVNIMPTGPGEPIAMYNAGGLFFSGSDTTSAVESDHPLVKADRLMTANAAISIGVIGDPDGPGHFHWCHRTPGRGPADLSIGNDGYPEWNIQWVYDNGRRWNRSHHPHEPCRIQFLCFFHRRSH